MDNRKDSIENDSQPILNAKNISGGYGNMRVLFDVNLQVYSGESIALVGRNGVGKTTLMKTLIGILSASSGDILLNGKNITSFPAYKKASCGIGWVPEGRRIFPNLTVKENLLVSASKRNCDLDEITELFPNLGKRMNNLGTQLSGGEQQMLAIARALLTEPELLLLDEATEGLAPVVRQQILSALGKLRKNITLIIVDKNLSELSELVKHFAVMEKGQVIYLGDDVNQVKEKIAL